MGAISEALGSLFVRDSPKKKQAVNRQPPEKQHISKPGLKKLSQPKEHVWM